MSIKYASQEKGNISNCATKEKKTSKKGQKQ